MTPGGDMNEGVFPTTTASVNTFYVDAQLFPYIRNQNLNLIYIKIGGNR